MAAIVSRSAGEGLERSCNAGDWVFARAPLAGIELLQAWFAGQAYARHRHDTYAIGVTDVGVQTFDYRGKVESSRPGQVTVLHPDEAHDGRAGAAGGFGYHIVYIDPACIAEAVRAITGRPSALPFVREPVADSPTLAGAVADAFLAPTLEPLALDSLVVRLAEGLLQGDPNRPSVSAGRRLDLVALARARTFLDGQRATARSTELEAVTGLNRYELARQFRALYGTSPHRYGLMRRLDFTRNRLHDGMPLVDLALTAGFADQAHFTRMFRSAFGLTPGRYARLHGAHPDNQPGPPLERLRQPDNRPGPPLERLRPPDSRPGPVLERLRQPDNRPGPALERLRQGSFT